MSVLVLSLVVAAAAQDSSVRAKDLKTEFVTKATTAELAKEVLPPEIAAKMKGHKLNPPHLHWVEGYPARFWGGAIEIEPGFCQRATYYVPMPQRTKGTLTPGQPSPDAQIKMATDCATASEPFISLNRAPPEKVVEVLRWLNEAHLSARSTGELQADVDCRSEQDPNPCLKGARKVLAELPLAETYIVERGSRAYDGEDWRISIKPAASSGNYYWQVSIFNFAGARPRVRISWDVIPPF